MNEIKATQFTGSYTECWWCGTQIRGQYMSGDVHYFMLQGQFCTPTHAAQYHETLGDILRERLEALELLLNNDVYECPCSSETEISGNCSERVMVHEIQGTREEPYGEIEFGSLSDVITEEHEKHLERLNDGDFDAVGQILAVLRQRKRLLRVLRGEKEMLS